MSEPWPWLPLASVFEIARGGSPRPIDDYLTDDISGIPWIMIGDATDSGKHIKATRKRIRVEGVVRSRSVQPGDFLLTNSMSFGRPYITKISGCVHDGWLVLSPKTRNFSPDFFYHLLGSQLVYSEFKRLAAGATVKNLNIELVKSVRVPVPPFSEQRRIAEVLDRAEALRAKRRAALAKIEALPQAVFLDMFGDTTKADCHPCVALAECAEVVSGIAKGRKLDGREAVEAPYLRVANVQAGYLDLSEVKTIEALPSEVADLALKAGDVLLTEGGDFDKLGRGALFEGQIQGCIHQNHVFRVRTDATRLLPGYFHEYLQAPAARTYFLRCAKRTTNLASINMTQLRSLPVPLPEIGIQREFSRRVAAVGKLKASLRASLAELDALFASLQHRAFRGEL